MSAFTYRGIEITDPTLDETGRLEVDPETYYGTERTWWGSRPDGSTAGVYWDRSLNTWKVGRWTTRRAGTPDSWSTAPTFTDAVAAAQRDGYERKR